MGAGPTVRQISDAKRKQYAAAREVFPDATKNRALGGMVASRGGTRYRLLCRLVQASNGEAYLERIAMASVDGRTWWTASGWATGWRELADAAELRAQQETQRDQSNHTDTVQ